MTPDRRERSTAVDPALRADEIGVMVTKEELEKSTFIGRNGNVWFMTAWALMMFIIDGVVYAVDPPPGESKWGYGPTVFLLCLVRHRETNERRVEGESKRDRGDARKGGRMAIRAMRRRKRRAGRIETRTRTRPRARDRARFTKRRREGRRETTRGESGESGESFATTDGERCVETRADRVVSLGRGVDS